ncbi:MAG TPA: hypothetical protein VJ888_03560 [Mobilitalea sp.]|nr:hypothetical protein [Mobilitalea sp.]
MNNSKRTIKGPQKAKKPVKKLNRKLWIIPSIIIGILLVVAILFDQLYESVVITVDGDKLRLDDLRYYFYTVESQTDYINQLYGGTYWDMTYNETTGATVRDMAKQEAVSAALYNEIMYREAVNKDYTLSTEESDKIATDVASMLYEQNIPVELLDKNGFTGKYLTKVFGKLALADRYRQDVVDTLDIDDAGITETIIYDDYKQYDIEYLFITTKTSDAEGNSVPMEEAAKTAAYEKLKAQYDAALTTEDWSTLIVEEEKELKYQKDNFLVNDTTFTEEFKTMMIAMENNTISNIYEDESGYYLVRMINNNSSESYDKAVTDAIKQAEDAAFQTYYTENIINEHNFKINNSAIKSLRMGNITLVN